MIEYHIGFGCLDVNKYFNYYTALLIFQSYLDLEYKPLPIDLQVYGWTAIDSDKIDQLTFETRHVTHQRLIHFNLKSN